MKMNINIIIVVVIIIIVGLYWYTNRSTYDNISYDTCMKNCAGGDSDPTVQTYCSNMCHV